jgi:hypothetical protein
VALCTHLRPVEDALTQAGAKELSRGQAWSKNCREWVYVDRFLDTGAILTEFQLPPCVEAYVHRGTHDGSERGIVCTEHQDAIMGPVDPSPDRPSFPR